MPALLSLVYQSLASLALREHRHTLEWLVVGEQAICHRPVLDSSSKDRKQTQSDFPNLYLVRRAAVACARL